MLFRAVDKSKLPTGSPASDALKTHVAAIQAGMNFDTISPVIEAAELTYIEPSIGPELYKELITAFNAYSSASDKQKELITALQKGLAFFVWHESSKELLTSLSDLGAHETRDTLGVVTGPRQWTYKQVLKDSFRKGNFFLDRALGILEKEKASFSKWTSSDTYKKSKSLFFTSSTELSNLLPSAAPRVVFYQLRPYIKEAEIRYIRPLLGAEFFDELKEAIVGGTLDDKQKAAIEKIQAALIKWTVICAVPNLRLNINREGLLEVTFNQDEIFQQERPREDSIRSLWVTLTQAGDLFLLELKNFLLQNIADYPTFEAAAESELEAPFSGIITQGEDGEFRSVYGFI